MNRYAHPTAAAWLTPLLLATTALSAAVQAQAPADDFVPVTDAMLQDPPPEEWLMWRAHPRRLGLQPARPDRPRQRRRPPHGLVTRPRPRQQPGHAARLPRGDVHAEPRRHHPGPRRGHRRPPLGGTGATTRRTSPTTSRGCRAPTGTSPSTTGSSSTPASTTTSSPSTRRPAGSPGRRRSSTTAPCPRTSRRDPSSPAARSCRAGGACPEAGPNACVVTAHDAATGEELWRTRPDSRPRRARATRRGEACRSRSGATSARGWCRATTPR